MLDKTKSAGQANLHEFFTLAGLRDDSPLIESAGCSTRQLKRGETLFYPGDRFTNIYGIHSGFFKTFLLDHDGREQVSGFFMSGDILGLDGTSAGHHAAGAVALEAAEICTIPFAAIEELARRNPELQRHLHGIFAREIVRNYFAMMVLGSMSAMERLATFLVNLSKRYERAGYSPSEFNLRMTRQEIGSYLGLTIETVSRLFSSLAHDGLLEVDQKRVRIADIPGLERLLNAHGAPRPRWHREAV